jgi:uncharacterized membrane protein
MTLASLSIPQGPWLWVALAAAVLLVPLAWLSLAPAGRDSRTMAVGLALRTLAVGFLLVCLLDLRWTAPRAAKGENAFAVLVDDSASLSVRDSSDDEIRGERLRALLPSGPGTWTETLASDFQLRRYAFGRDVRRIRDADDLGFTEDRSDLVSALARLARRSSGAPLAGILVLSDGNATDRSPGVEPDLAGLPPVHVVVLGREGTPDLRIESATVEARSFDDMPLALRVEVSRHGALPAEATVSVRPLVGSIGETSPPPTRIRFPDTSSAPISTTLRWNSESSGIGFHVVEVVPDGGAVSAEATTLNNRRLVAVDRGLPERRILYVGGRPGWEFKYLNRALSADPRLRLSGIIRVAKREPKFDFKGRAGEASNPMFRGFGAEAEETTRYDEPVLVRVHVSDDRELRDGFPKTAEELFEYDAVVLDSVEASFFTHDQLVLLRGFVADRGGGLLMLGGADSLDDGGYARSPLASVLPVYLDRTAERAPQGRLRWSLTREGWVQPWMRVAESETAERARLDAMPSLLVGHALVQTKPGATVFAQFEDEEGVTYPGLVAQTFGAGRAAIVAAGDLWRWGLRDSSEAVALERFWRQTARWLVSESPPRVSVVARPTTGGSTRLEITARDRAHVPADDAVVSVSIERIQVGDESPNDGFSSLTLDAAPDPAGRGRYALVVPARESGAYRARVEVTTAGSGDVLGTAETGWTVDASHEEFRSADPDRAFLEDIARRTGGSVVDASELDAFARSLPNLAAPITTIVSEPVWHSPWLLLATLACLGAEWLWRRWRGLP